MSAVARMLDANFNRAREAMRVMEDVARFALNDADLARELKLLRHDLQAVLQTLPPGRPPGWMEHNRDTPDDVGTTISTAGEMSRTGLFEIAVAAGKRLSESLRVIEELCKTLDAQIAQKIEAMRYRGYGLDAQLHTRMATGRAAQWSLCVLLTESLCGGEWRQTLANIISAGADCIQIREKQLDDRQLLERVRQTIEMARPAGVSVIVNDRADIALAAGADGVHVGQNDLSVTEIRKIAGRSLLIGVSTHNLDEARAAVDCGADYCGVGAMFATPLKPGRSPSGIEYLKQFLHHHPTATMPHLAIGGITPENVMEVIEAGARGIAVSTAVCGAIDPAAATRALLTAISKREAVHAS